MIKFLNLCARGCQEETTKSKIMLKISVAWQSLLLFRTLPKQADSENRE